MSTRNIVVAVALLIPALAWAQVSSTSRIDQRQANQQKRIGQGVQSGQLTPKEAARLEKGEAHVQNMENKAVADGKVTARERARVEHAQDQQSRKIFREKHDRQHVRK